MRPTLISGHCEAESRTTNALAPFLLRILLGVVWETCSIWHQSARKTNSVNVYFWGARTFLASANFFSKSACSDKNVKVFVTTCNPSRWSWRGSALPCPYPVRLADDVRASPTSCFRSSNDSTVLSPCFPPEALSLHHRSTASGWCVSSRSDRYSDRDQYLHARIRSDGDFTIGGLARTISGPPLEPDLNLFCGCVLHLIHPAKCKSRCQWGGGPGVKLTRFGSRIKYRATLPPNLYRCNAHDSIEMRHLHLPSVVWASASALHFSLLLTATLPLAWLWRWSSVCVCVIYLRLDSACGSDQLTCFELGGSVSQQHF